MIPYSQDVKSDAHPDLIHEGWRAQPNLRLQAHRARLGVTQAEVAELLAALAWRHDGLRLGLDATMVSKWERGLKRPRKIYRQLLCMLYGTNEERLGIGPPTPPVYLGEERYGGDVNRRQFLQGAAAVGLAAVTPVTSLDKVVRAFDKPAVDPSAIDAYASIAAAQRQMYWSSSGRSLYESTVSHLRLGLDLLRNNGGSNRPELLTAVAHSALLSWYHPPSYS